MQHFPSIVFLVFSADVLFRGRSIPGSAGACSMRSVIGRRNQQKTMVDEPLHRAETDQLDKVMGRSWSEVSSRALERPLSPLIMAASAKRRVRIRKVRSSRDDRRCPGVEPPAKNILQMSEAFSRGRPRLDVLRDHLYREGRLHEAVALRIIYTAAGFFREEANLIEVEAPVVICGNIQGQFYDLLHLFEVGGSPKTTNYLFLGDYVNRGSFGLECVLYLFALKIVRRNTFFLLRGHHESKHLCEHYTFQRECLAKYSTAIYRACVEAFNCLPLAALVDQALFCVHGGLSPELETLSDINKIDRFQEPPNSGLMCDLLWGDPASKLGSVWTEFSGGFIENKSRQVSYLFSFQAACSFLERNSLLGIVRSHQPVRAGHEMSLPNQQTRFPAVITIFSSPNYADFYGNKGAVLVYSRKEAHVKQFSHSPHPYWLPNFENAFSWSFPFLIQKINEILFHCVKFYTRKRSLACRDEKASISRSQTPDTSAQALMISEQAEENLTCDRPRSHNVRPRLRLDSSSLLKLIGKTARKKSSSTKAPSQENELRALSNTDGIRSPKTPPEALLSPPTEAGNINTNYPELTPRASTSSDELKHQEHEQSGSQDLGQLEHAQHGIPDYGVGTVSTASTQSSSVPSLEKGLNVNNVALDGPGLLETAAGLSGPNSPVSLTNLFSLTALSREGSVCSGSLGLPNSGSSEQSSPSRGQIAVASPLQGSANSFQLPTIMIN